MADVTIVVRDVSIAGLDFAANKITIATANVYYFSNTGREKLWLDNTAGATVNVTVETPKTDADGNAIADKVASVLTLKRALIGPFKTGVYNKSDDTVKLTFDQIVDVVVFRG